MVIVGMLLVGIVDYFVPFELSIVFFYVIPVGFAAWLGGKWMGVIAAVFAGIVWLVSDVMSGHQFSHHIFLYWNAMVRLILFALIAYFMGSLRQQLKRASEAALTDALTGIANSRDFLERLEREIARSQRFEGAFTLVYIDLDNFKQVNDTEGHTAGDRLLRTVAYTMKSSMRNVDLVARIGGDEFAVLLVETGMEEARLVLEKLQARLLAAMQAEAWPVTFSIGAVIFKTPPQNSDAAIKLADDAMYQIKKGGKNNIRVSAHEEIKDAAVRESIQAAR